MLAPQITLPTAKETGQWILTPQPLPQRNRRCQREPPAPAPSAAAARAVTAVKVYGRGPARLKWHRCRPFRGRTSSAAT